MIKIKKTIGVGAPTCGTGREAACLRKACNIRVCCCNSQTCLKCCSVYSDAKLCRMLKKPAVSCSAHKTAPRAFCPCAGFSFLLPRSARIGTLHSCVDSTDQADHQGHTLAAVFPASVLSQTWPRQKNKRAPGATGPSSTREWLFNTWTRCSSSTCRR